MKNVLIPSWIPHCTKQIHYIHLRSASLRSFAVLNPLSLPVLQVLFSLQVLGGKKFPFLSYFSLNAKCLVNIIFLNIIILTLLFANIIHKTLSYKMFRSPVDNFYPVQIYTGNIFSEHLTFITTAIVGV